MIEHKSALGAKKEKNGNLSGSLNSIKEKGILKQVSCIYLNRTSGNQ